MMPFWAREEWYTSRWILCFLQPGSCKSLVSSKLSTRVPIVSNSNGSARQEAHTRLEHAMADKMFNGIIDGKHERSR